MFTALRIVSSVMILAAIPQQPMAYYSWLRWVVFATCFVGIYLAGTQKKFVWLVVLAVFALVFNPFRPLSLTREVWIAADIALLAAFACSYFAPKLKLN